MKNMEIILIITCFITACTESKYEAYLEPIGVKDVTSVRISPNCTKLIADGISELQLEVTPYVNVTHTRRIEMIVNGKQIIKDSIFTTSTSLENDRISPSDIVIKTLNGEVVEDGTYRTNQGAGSTIEFVAIVNGIESKPCQVELIAPPVIDFKPITIPVVFHLLVPENSNEMFNGMTVEFFQKLLEHTNGAFAASLIHAPCAIDTKIKFILSPTDVNGEKLEEEGINRLDIGNMTQLEVNEYINKNLLWDPNRFLNIYINPTTYQSSASGPQYVLDNGTTLAGFNLIPVANTTEITWNNYNETGITLRASDVFDLADCSEKRLEYYIGLYYGLIPTMYEYYGAFPYINGDVDYCNDTYTYNMTTSIDKSTYRDSSEENIYFYSSYNIMDTYSKSSTITYEQALRLRTVMENCPGRMHN